MSLWPQERRADAKAGKYILGHTDTNGTDIVVDVRGEESNTYYTSRFYVGYKTEYVTYELQKSYGCDDDSQDVWITDRLYTQMDKIFDDGVWMTQNLRAKKTSSGSDIALGNSTINSANKQYYVGPNVASTLSTNGVFYNWATVINMGTGEGQTPDPGSVDQGGSGKRDVRIQGICPNGWHVPSMQEITDLYNGLNLNAPYVSAETVGGTSNVFSYNIVSTNDPGYVKGPLWNAIRASSMGGNSDLANAGGFYSLAAGRPPSVRVNSYYWTASSTTTSSSSRAYGTYITDMGVLREKMSRTSYSSVRCMRDTK